MGSRQGQRECLAPPSGVGPCRGGLQWHLCRRWPAGSLGELMHSLQELFRWQGRPFCSACRQANKEADKGLGESIVPRPLPKVLCLGTASQGMKGLGQLGLLCPRPGLGQAWERCTWAGHTSWGRIEPWCPGTSVLTPLHRFHTQKQGDCQAVAHAASTLQASVGLDQACLQLRLRRLSSWAKGGLVPPLRGQLPAFPVSWWLSQAQLAGVRALLWRAWALAARVQLCSRGSPSSLGVATRAGPTGSALHRPSGRHHTHAR